ncbi:MAG: AsmA-like C-terminal region-containing protein [Candidatus Binatia bacterium]
MSLLLTDFGLQAELMGKDIKVKHFRLTALGSVIEGQGRVQSILDNPAINLAINALGEIEDLFPRRPPVRLLGKFRLVGKITGPIMDPLFTGQVKVGQGQMEQIAISGINMVVEGNRHRLHLKQLDMRGADGTLTGDMTLTWKSLQYRLNLLGKRVNLTQILQLLAGEASVGGHMAIEAQVVGEGTDLSKLKGQIKIGIEDFHLIKRPEERGHLRISLEGRDNRVQIQQLEISIAQSSLQAEGVLEADEKLYMSVVAQTSKLEQIAALFGSKPDELAGEVKFKGHLTGPLADPVLKGSLDWSKAKLLGIALDSVKGPVELALAQRTLKSPSLDVIRQDLRGKFNVGLALLPKPPDRNLTFKNDLKLNIDGDVEGPWEKFIGIFFKKQFPITGAMQLRAEIQGTPENLSGQGTLVVTDLNIFEMPWDRSVATVHLKQRNILLEGLEIQKGDEKITGRSEVGFDGHIGGNLSSTPISIQRVARLRNAGFTGTAKILLAKSEGAVGQEHITAKLEFGDLAYRGSSLGPGQGTFNWDRSKEQLTGHMMLPDRGYSLRGDLLTKANFPYKGTLTLEKGDLVSLLRMVRDRLPTQLSGIGSGQINISGRLGEEIPDLVTVDLETTKLAIQGHSFQTAGRTKLTFKEGQLTLLPVTLKGEGADLLLGGTIGKEMNLTIRGTAPTVLASILSPEISGAKGVMNLDMVIRGPRELPRYRGRIETKDSSLTFRGHPEPFEKLRGEIRFTESSAESTGLEAQWGGGKLRVILQGKRGQKGWRWPVEFTLEDARVERIVVTRKDEELPALVTGELQSSGTLTITTAPGLEWLSSLEGKVKLKAVDGNILRSFVLEKILTAINITGLFKKGHGGKGMPYDEMSATFLLDKGVAKTEDLLLRSPPLRGGGTGQIDLVQRTCDAYVAVQPLQLTDSVVRGASNLPLIKHLGVGSLLFGKDKSILVVAYHVHGPLANLQLDHIPTRGIQGGVLGIFDKTLGLPIDLFMQGGKQLEDKRGNQEEKDEADDTR